MASVPTPLDAIKQTLIIHEDNDSKKTKVEIEKEYTSEASLMQKVSDDETPAAEQWKFLQSTDEMTTLITQFSNKKMIENEKSERKSAFSSFDSILEEDIVGKIERILNIAKGGNVGHTSMLSYCSSLFPDVSDLVLAIRELLKRKDLDEISKKNLEEMLESIEETYISKIIKSGINCAIKAKIYGKKLDLLPQLLRAAYRNFLSANKSIIEDYIDLISNFGIERRIDVINFIEDSLLCDISSMDPSCSIHEFGNYLTKLSLLRNIQSIEILFIKNIMKIKSVAKHMTEDNLLVFILHVLQRPMAIDNILAEQFNCIFLNIEKKEIIKILSILHTEIRKLPAHLFGEKDEQQEVLNYFRTVINKKISKVRHGLDKR